MNHLIYTIPAFCLVAALLFSCGNPGPKREGTRAETPDPDTIQTSKNQNPEMMEVLNRMVARMRSMPLPKDFDMVFTNMMIIHHQAGIELAEIEVAKGTDEEIRAIARNLIRMLTNETKELEEIASSHKTSIFTEEEHPELIADMNSMMESMRTVHSTGDTDSDFARMMIRHHESGIRLAVQQVNNGHHVHLKLMARDMIAQQQSEVEKLEEWIRR